MSDNSRDEKTPRVLPKSERGWGRIDVDLALPCGLVAMTMKLAVMGAANRNRKFVAHFAAERT
jgi:hypothetical protein